MHSNEEVIYDERDELEEEDEEEAYCTVTNRILVISPLPQRIHELIRGLSGACYDVMVFHHAEPELLLRLQTQLLIVDRTHSAAAPDLGWLNQPEFAGLAVLQLVSADTRLDTLDEQLGLSIQWPCPMPEVLTTVRASAVAAFRYSRAAASQAKAEPTVSDELRLKDLLLDLKRHTVFHGSERIDLTRIEFDLLKALMEARGSVLSRQDLLDQVWGNDYYGGSNTVDVHVKALRQKLTDDPKAPRYIATVRGIGYRLAD